MLLIFIPLSCCLHKIPTDLWSAALACYSKHLDWTLAKRDSVPERYSQLAVAVALSAAAEQHKLQLKDSGTLWGLNDDHEH